MKEKMNEIMTSLSEHRKAIQEKLSDVITLILILANRMETAVVIASIGFLCLFEAEFGQILSRSATKFFSSGLLLLICSLLLLLIIYIYKDIYIYHQRLLLLAFSIVFSYLIIIGLCNNKSLDFVTKLVLYIGQKKLTTIVTSLAFLKIIIRLDQRYREREEEEEEENEE